MIVTLPQLSDAMTTSMITMTNQQRASDDVRKIPTSEIHSSAAAEQEGDPESTVANLLVVL